MDFSQLRIMSPWFVWFFSSSTNLPTFKCNNSLLNLACGIAES